MKSIDPAPSFLDAATPSLNSSPRHGRFSFPPSLSPFSTKYPSPASLSPSLISTLSVPKPPKTWDILSHPFLSLLSTFNFSLTSHVPPSFQPIRFLFSFPSTFMNILFLPRFSPIRTIKISLFPSPLKLKSRDSLSSFSLRSRLSLDSIKISLSLPLL
jgi:hypothetical protein